MIDAFAVGVITGLAWVFLFGILEGLFGDRALSLLMGVLLVGFLGIASTSGVESTAAGFGPWVYYLGIAVGSIIGYVPSRRVRSDIEREGEPYVWSIMR